MQYGLQDNNYSPMGLGQPQSGKAVPKKKPNFMQDTMGYTAPQDMIPESVSPGVPTKIGDALNARANNQPTSHGYSSNLPPGDNPNSIIQAIQQSQNSNIPSVPNATMPQVPQGNQPQTGGVPQSYTASIFQGFTPNQTMHGFDFNREQNTGKSAKDAFAWLAQQAAAQGHPAPLNAVGDAAKGQYGDWFNTYIAPGMNALGHTIDNVQGDKFTFHNWQGKYNVDFGEGAGAANGA